METKREIPTNSKVDTSTSISTAKEAKRKRGQEKRAKRKAALKRVLDFVKANCKGDTALLNDLAFLTPGNRTSLRATPASAIKEAFLKKKEWPENVIWEQFKLGRVEMRKICKKLIKDAKPEERMWIRPAGTEKITYVLVHTGKNAPKDWSGYIPVTAEDLLQ